MVPARRKQEAPVVQGSAQCPKVLTREASHVILGKTIMGSRGADAGEIAWPRKASRSRHIGVGV
jgi:hypothetical protein